MSIFDENKIVNDAELVLKINSVKKWVDENCKSNAMMKFGSNLSEYLNFTLQNDYITVEGSYMLYINTPNIPPYIKFNTQGIVFEKYTGDIPIYSLTPGYHYSVYVTNINDNTNLIFPDYHLDIGSLFITGCKNLSLDIPTDNTISKLSIYNSDIIKYNILCNVAQLDMDDGVTKSLLYLFMKDSIAKPDNIKIY